MTWLKHRGWESQSRDSDNPVENSNARQQLYSPFLSNGEPLKVFEQEWHCVVSETLTWPKSKGQGE